MSALAFYETVDTDALNSELVFDLTDWDAEVLSLPPENDAVLSDTAIEIQRTISEHRPIDTSVDWEDFEAYLPAWASPLLSDDDVETRERLRLVFLRAIREGSVPHSLLEAIVLGDDDAPSEEATAVLRMVVNDLGAETDERFEYLSPYENFVVSVAPKETPDEEDTVADAFAFIDDLTARHNESHRIYQRVFQREMLLTAEAEVTLGQAMERGVGTALDALASWPTGIKAVKDAAKLVILGTKPLRWLSSSPSIELQDAEPASCDEPTSDLPTETVGVEDEDDSQFGREAKQSIDELTEFSANLEFLSSLAIGTSQAAPEWRACRGAITSMRLTRGFLMELADSGLAGELESGKAFIQAIKAYRCARDQMAVANLKLVLSIAKKYLFSGQPLDDLVQEGNVGLIKAVDRYDWRRGFKFSTYATWWIRQQVGRHVADKSKTIRLPVHVYEKTQRIDQTARAFEVTHGHAPTIEEIAELVELPVQKVLALARVSLEPLPLYEIDCLDDLIAADVKDEFIARDPMEVVEDIQLIASIDRFLGTLKRKEGNILRMRFGIGTQESMTLEEIGDRLDVTRERIRQIETTALRKLKHPARLDRLLCELNRARTTRHDEPEGSATESDAEAAGGAQSYKPSKWAAPRPARTKGSGQSALDKLLDHARASGVVVEDKHEGAQRIWVHITDTPDNRSRRLVRKLIELGFESWPGKGYWR